MKPNVKSSLWPLWQEALVEAIDLALRGRDAILTVDDLRRRVRRAILDDMKRRFDTVSDPYEDAPEVALALRALALVWEVLTRDID